MQFACMSVLSICINAKWNHVSFGVHHMIFNLMESISFFYKQITSNRIRRVGDYYLINSITLQSELQAFARALSTLSICYCTNNIHTEAVSDTLCMYAHTGTHSHVDRKFRWGYIYLHSQYIHLDNPWLFKQGCRK